jgi:hypothetical protein
MAKKPKGAPDFHHSDAPDAEGKFKELAKKNYCIVKSTNSI